MTKEEGKTLLTLFVLVCDSQEKLLGRGVTSQGEKLCVRGGVRGDLLQSLPSVAGDIVLENDRADFGSVLGEALVHDDQKIGVVNGKRLQVTHHSALH